MDLLGFGQLLAHMSLPLPAVELDTAGQIAAHIFVDYIAVLVGVVYGALYAIKHKLDIVGTVALALVTGYGGGILRDILLHDQGFFFMQHPNVILASIIISVLVFLFRKRLTNLEPRLFYIDAISMSLWALAGAAKAWDAGAAYIIVIILGALTAVGGGVLRNICIGEVPWVFQAGNFYALSALAGCTLYVALLLFGVPAPIPDIACMVVAFLLTVLSVKFNWHTKVPD